MNREEYTDILETDNAELKKENQELMKQLENKNKQIEYLRRSIERKEDTIIDLQNETIPYINEHVCKLETQQKEFIKYLEKTIVDSKAGSGQQYYFQEILSTYKSVIGWESD